MAETKPADTDHFGEFLKAAEDFLVTTVDGLVDAAGQDDDAPQLASHSNAIKDQLRKVLTLTKEKYAAVNSETRRVVDDLMKVQAVTGMAKGAKAAMRQSLSAARFGDGIFSWIESNLEEIKKLVEELWSIFGGAPPWLTKLFQIIDQLWKMIGGLLGGIFGRNRSRIMSELSQMEVEFWNELAAHARHRAVVRAAATEVED